MKTILFLKTLLLLNSSIGSIPQNSLINGNQPDTNSSSGSALSSRNEQNIKNKCGVSHNIGSAQRIIGGRSARDGEFPWKISLYKNGLFSCGGSIIEKKSILTAAHCVQGSLASELMIRYNSLFRSDSDFEMSVSKIIIHPEYDIQTLDNDIAVLQLTKKLSLDRTNAGSICLPSKGDRISSGDIVTITGWGRTDSGQISIILRAIDVPIVSLSTCRNQYKNLPIFKITDNMICAGLFSGGKDSCNGDSGGPMIKSFDGSVSVQIGIVSKGRGCALPKLPGIYTSVANYVEWINRNKI